MKRARLLIRERLKALGRSEYWLVQQMGMGRGGIQAYLDGTSKRLSLDLIDRLCQVLECEPGDLIQRLPPAKEESKGQGVTLRIAAKTLGVSHETVRTWIRKGLLKADTERLYPAGGMGVIIPPDFKRPTQEA